MTKLPLSLVVITKNEEANLRRCLASVPWAEDIVVLDSGSTDQTVAIAQELGARVFIEEWRGYRAQKQRAVDLARQDWVLSLDADEALSKEAVAEIERSQNLWAEYDGFDFPRLSYYMGRWIRHGGWYPDRQLRLFHRKKAHWSEGHVHERVAAQNVYRMKADLYHYPFGSLRRQIDTNNEYSSLAAQDLFGRGKKFSLLKLLFKPVGKFIETYLIKRGCLDGLPGFIISVGASYSMFLKFAKLRELEQQSTVSS